MDVRITVTKAGGENLPKRSNSILARDVMTIEQVHELVDREFGKDFPKYQPLDQTPGTGGSGCAIWTNLFGRLSAIP